MSRIRLSPRVSIGLIVAVLVAVGGFFAFQYMLSAVPVTISYKNSHGIVVYDSHETQGDGDRKLVATITESGQTKRLKKNHSYIVSYRGDEGFSGGEITLGPLNSKQGVSIDPYFSEDKLKTFTDQNTGQIEQALQAKFAHINLYKILPGKFYHFGDWYGTTLKYIGSDNFNDDTIRVVLQQENGTWNVKTDIADITLSKYLYPDIPVDILRDVNRL